MNPYYANKVRHQLQDVLRMTDANPAFVTAWAEAIAHAARNESDTLTARRIEHHGVLVDRDGTIYGYAESTPLVGELGSIRWTGYTLTPETCLAIGVSPTRRISAGRGYWFKHPNLAGGRSLAHVKFSEVGMGSALDERGKLRR